MNIEESQTAVLELLLGIAPEIDPSDLDPDEDLRTAVDLDSLDFLNLIEQISKGPGVDIPEADYPKVRSLRGLAEYVSAHT